jgi:hypothetical protein
MSILLPMVTAGAFFLPQRASYNSYGYHCTLFSSSTGIIRLLWLPLHPFFLLNGHHTIPIVTIGPFSHATNTLPTKKRLTNVIWLALIYAPGGSLYRVSRLTNLLYSFTKASETVPVGPLRCFAMMISIIFLFSDSLS